MEREQLVSTVLAAQNGDSNALNDLFNAFYNDVYYFALKTVKEQDLACDITQETFVEIINTLGNLQEPAAFVTWMKQVTYHQCTRYFKKKKDVLVAEDSDGHTIFDTVEEDRTEFIPDAALDQEDFRRTILSMLDQLSEEQRAATMMYYFDEMSVKQIAAIQGVSEGTVKSRLNYARKSIKSSVESYEKRTGVKLHSFGFVPLFAWLFRDAFVKAMPAASAQTVAASVSAATGVTVTVATGAAAVSAATVATVTTVSSTLATKIIAGVVATSLTIGGGLVAANLIKGDKRTNRPSGEESTSKSTSSAYDREWAGWTITAYAPKLTNDFGQPEDTEQFEAIIGSMDDSFKEQKLTASVRVVTRQKGDGWQVHTMQAGDFRITEEDIDKALSQATPEQVEAYENAIKYHYDPEKLVFAMLSNGKEPVPEFQDVSKLAADHAFHFLSEYGAMYAREMDMPDFENITLSEFNVLSKYVLGRTYEGSEFTGLYATYHPEDDILKKNDKATNHSTGINQEMIEKALGLLVAEISAFRTVSSTQPEGAEGVDYLYCEEENLYLCYDYTKVIIQKLVDGQLQCYIFTKPGK